ncbi:MAG: hypothetical protein V3V40_05985 [Nitrosomonadaceae bacterium]
MGGILAGDIPGVAMRETMNGLEDGMYGATITGGCIGIYTNSEAPTQLAVT